VIDLDMAQAVFDRTETGPALKSRSPNFRDEWTDEAERICVGYGERPRGVACPGALFALPFGRSHVVVGHARDLDATGSLRFHFLVLGRELYGHLGDPFAIAERFPPSWFPAGELPDLRWPEEPLPARRVEDLQGMMRETDGPFLYGAAQTLVDHGRIALKRSEPADRLLRELWQLLPASTRRERWPATFAFGNDLGFDVVALPVVPEEGLQAMMTEEQVLDYPESRYERALQVAIEAGDQGGLDRLLARRSSTETLRLAVYIVLGFAVASIVLRIVLAAR
jgi:hypothetical protein